MPGMNENLVFPILDLIKRELRKSLVVDREGEHPLDDVPSVRLIRNHHLDPSKVVVTKAELIYQSGFAIDVILEYGALNSPFILNIVTVRCFDIKEVTPKLLVTYVIQLEYDERGLLVSTLVNKVEANQESP